MTAIRSGMSNLTVRVLAAVVLIPLVLLAVWAGPVAFMFLVGGVALIMAQEWADIAFDGDAGQRLMLAAAGVSGAVAGLGGPFLWPALCVMALAWAGSILLRAETRRGFSLYHITGVPYVGLAALALVALRMSETCGLPAILFLFMVVWMADTLAYFAGRALGGPKLAPKISPNKTWAGFLGAMFGGGIAALVFVLFSGTFNAPLIVAGFVLGAWEQLGDLFESALKRRYGVKDSGTIIPGHGGVLDRVDGLVAAAVLAFLWGLASTQSLRDAACGVLFW